ncbi:MAG: GNAT family N-acetyltransferase [Bacteroidota bacterium]
MSLSLPEIILAPATPVELAQMAAQLPEFSQPYGADIIALRLSQAPHWGYQALIDGQVAGFKVGYERTPDGSFYSWLGGVLPPYRRMGVAQQLAEGMETWAKAQGYTQLRFKTRNRHRKMLQFALKQGFDIVGVDPYPDRAEHRIWLEKDL